MTHETSTHIEGEVLDRPNGPKVSDRRASALAEQRAHQPVADMNPGRLLELAVTQNAGLDQLERLMKLKREYEADEARKAYVAAMARFKASPPVILKDKHVGFDSKDGSSRTEYSHATLGNVTTAICVGLAECGFSHRWDVQQADQITVTCTITHELGHSESVTMRAGKDDSGKKNHIQQIASTVTYLQRYTLLAATGLAVQDGTDDDARGSGDNGASAPITEQQENELHDLLERHVNNKPKFYSFLTKRLKVKVEKLSDVPAKAFQFVKDELEAIGREKKAPAK